MSDHSGKGEDCLIFSWFFPAACRRNGALPPLSAPLPPRDCPRPHRCPRRSARGYANPEGSAPARPPPRSFTPSWLPQKKDPSSCPSPRASGRPPSALGRGRSLRTLRPPPARRHSGSGPARQRRGGSPGRAEPRRGRGAGGGRRVPPLRRAPAPRFASGRGVSRGAPNNKGKFESSRRRRRRTGCGDVREQCRCQPARPPPLKGARGSARGPRRRPGGWKGRGACAGPPALQPPAAAGSLRHCPPGLGAEQIPRLTAPSLPCCAPRGLHRPNRCLQLPGRTGGRRGGSARAPPGRAELPAALRGWAGRALGSAA